MCESEGYCPRFHREMHGAFHKVCQGGEGVNLDSRALVLAEWSRQRDQGLASRSRGTTCKYLGEETGLRECASCRGKTRVKVFQCFHHNHTETTVNECKICPDYDNRIIGTIGGIPDRFDLADHLGLSFSANARTALYNSRDKSIDMEGTYRGATAYFLGGGPSLLDMDIGRLSDKLTFAVNGVSEIYPNPTIWSCVDTVDRFSHAPWDNPNVIKVVPRGLMATQRRDGKRVFESNNIYYFLRDARFKTSDFLTRRTFNWGSDADIGGGRSVMLTSLKLLWWFGVRRVILLGCDFHMKTERPYAHSAEKDAKGCESNNRKFVQLNERFQRLRPIFESAGMEILNGTPGSGLTAFENVRFEDYLE